MLSEKNKDGFASLFFSGPEQNTSGIFKCSPAPCRLVRERSYSDTERNPDMNLAIVPSLLGFQKETGMVENEHVSK